MALSASSVMWTGGCRDNSPHASILSHTFTDMAELSSLTPLKLKTDDLKPAHELL